MSTEDSVKVGIRLKPGDGFPAAEWMWAKPVRAHDGGGTYELHNTSFYVPLAVGDVVRAEVNGDGLLQVTDIVCPGPRVMSWAVVSLASSDQVAAIGDRWRERGANWSEGSGRVLSTVWDEGVSREQVEQALAVDLLADRIEWVQVIAPDERTAAAQEDIDFELDSSRIPGSRRLRHRARDRGLHQRRSALVSHDEPVEKPPGGSSHRRGMGV